MERLGGGKVGRGLWENGKWLRRKGSKGWMESGQWVGGKGGTR
jgi:hypothetical protein